jgi:predicted RNA binding protein YcfA (HicA-like mRNA interferase family)
MKPITGKKMCKAVLRKGWIFTHATGGHRYYCSPDRGRTTCVPYHARDLKLKTQKSIMNAVGLTDADL